VEWVRETVSRLYDVDPNSINFTDSFYYDANYPNYLLLPDGFSPNVSEFDILADTITRENNIISFDVQFYDIGNAPGEKGDKLYKFRYEFSPDLYKDIIPCYRFIQATRID